MTDRRCAVSRCRGADAGYDPHAAGPVCGVCEHDGRSALRDLPRMFVALHLELGPAYSSMGERVAVSNAPAASMDLHTADVIRDLHRLLLGWESGARAALSLSPPSRISREHPVTRAVTLLSRQYDRLLALPRGPEFVSALLHVRAVCRRALGWHVLVHDLPAPCPTCDTLDLHRRDGDEYVYCGSCGAWWPEADYNRLVLVLAYELEGATR